MEHTTFLSDGERDLLREVLNRIIPSGAGMPAAGEIGVEDAVEGSLRNDPAQRRLFLEGLIWIERTAWRGHDREFAALQADLKDAVLQSAECEQSSFFDLLVSLTYRSYYSDARVKAALGIENRPPQPDGNRLPTFRAGLLDPVRARGPVYRKVVE
jgi:hypothetical protein